jgi:hypothetical protein
VLRQGLSLLVLEIRVVACCAISFCLTFFTTGNLWGVACAKIIKFAKSNASQQHCILKHFLNGKLLNCDWE